MNFNFLFNAFLLLTVVIDKSQRVIIGSFRTIRRFNFTSHLSNLNERFKFAISFEVKISSFASSVLHSAQFLSLGPIICSLYHLVQSSSVRICTRFRQIHQNQFCTLQNLELIFH